MLIPSPRGEAPIGSLPRSGKLMAERDKSERPPLVLIANDQEWSARSLESILAPNGFTVLRAYTGQQALQRARTAQPDLVILDAQMPDMHGTEVCRTLREDPRFSPAVPIIITTAGPSGRAQRLEAYRSGAWEFLGQPLDGEALLLKLHTFLKPKQEVDRILDENLLDHSTGLYNMRGLSRRAREIGSEAYRRHHPLACVVFSPDVDLGSEGEAASQEVARRLAERIGEVVRGSGRISDATGRVGPAEFAVIAPATSSEGAERLVERLGASMEAAAPVDLNGVPQRVRLRAGYCAVPDFSQAEFDTIEMLLRATTALRHVRANPTAGSIRSFEQIPAGELN
jgi:PleD family two-component response regulator